MATKELQKTSTREPSTHETVPERRRVIRPRCSIVGDDEKVLIRLEMPGVDKENLHIDIEDNELRVSGEKVRPVEGRHLIRERIDGDYAASYTLDETIDQERVEAELRDGVLTLTLHVKEAVKPKRIAIRTK